MPRQLLLALSFVWHMWYKSLKLRRPDIRRHEHWSDSVALNPGMDTNEANLNLAHRWTSVTWSVAVILQKTYILHVLKRQLTQKYFFCYHLLVSFDFRSSVEHKSHSGFAVTWKWANNGRNVILLKRTRALFCASAQHCTIFSLAILVFLAILIIHARYFQMSHACLALARRVAVCWTVFCISQKKWEFCMLLFHAKDTQIVSLLVRR